MKEGKIRLEGHWKKKKKGKNEVRRTGGKKILKSIKIFQRNREKQIIVS